MRAPTCRLKAASALFFLLPVLSAMAGAKPSEHIIYAFYGFTGDCAGPTAPLIMGGDGNLYGTAHDGGANSDGCIFKLAPNPDGTWTETVLYSFSGSDGKFPADALVFDKVGNLYGTARGGTYDAGVVYELSPTPSGQWTEAVLYNFGNGEDASGPGGNLIFDNAGNLYGTTEFGGKHRGGTVFRLSPGPNGWTETILYEFRAHIGGPGGDGPIGGVVMDNKGNLYGATAAGGNQGGYGAVYELHPKNGSYVGQLIHSFNGYDGWEPTSGLTMDSSGNLYGSTLGGGHFGGGAVFQLSKGAKGKWAVTVRHSFGSGNDGFYPVGPMVFDQAGNLYGATMSGGGPYPAIGTVYKLTQSRGTWIETILHVFDFGGTDGTSPSAGVILKGSVVYGTTGSGGSNNEGTVLSITPQSRSSVGAKPAPKGSLISRA